MYATRSDGDVEVREYERRTAAPARLLRIAVQRLIMRIEHSDAGTYNGGLMAFHPVNGLLYIAVGDGGTGGDTAQDGAEPSSARSSASTSTARISGRPDALLPRASSKHVRCGR